MPLAIQTRDARDLAALIPLPIKVNRATGHALTRADWIYEPSPAYEAAASTALPAGWRLYSKLDEGKLQAACDFGASRGEGEAFVHGVRFDSGAPKLLRAEVRRFGIHGTATAEFRAGDLAAAVSWCEDVLERRGLK